ncbi:hypothetical protein L0152_27900 [bacterium]|nr:hypothetical protein [bacterium]
MTWPITYLQYFGLLWLSLISFYLIGRVVVGLTSKIVGKNLQATSPSLHLCINIAAGITVSITFLSLFVTSGRTVNLLILYVVIVFLWTLKKSPFGSEKNIPRHLTKALIVELLIYGTAIYSLFALEIIRKSDWSSILQAQHLIDWGLYGVDVQTMLQTGQENTYNVHSFLDAAYRGMTPYHYFELWIGGIWPKLCSHVLPMYVFSLIVYPILCMFALIAGWMWLDEFRFSTRLSRFLVFLCLFTAGWFFLSSRFIKGSGFLRLLVLSFDDLNAFLMDVPKRAVVFSFLIGVILLIKNSKIVPAFILLLALPIFSVDSIAVVFGGTFLFVLYALRRKSISLSDGMFIYAAYGIFVVLFFLIYKAFGNHTISLYSPFDVIRQTFGLSSGQIVIPFLFATRALIATLALYSFHLVLLVRRGRGLAVAGNGGRGFAEVGSSRGRGFAEVGSGSPASDIKSILTLLFFMFLSGLAGWALLFSYIDAIQFFSGFLTALQTFILILCIPLIWVNGKSLTKVVFVVYLLITTSYNFCASYLPLNARLAYSQNYLDEIQKYKPASKVGISIQAEKDFSKQWAQRHVITHSLGDDYLIFMHQYIKPVEIGVFSVPETPFRPRPKKIPLLNISVDFEAVDAHRNRIMKESSIFYRYFNQVKKQNPSISIEEAQLRFIESHNIDWAILSKNVPINKFLQPRIERIITDEASGEIFMIFK